MKIPNIFVPEKKLDYKVEELLKEKPLQNSQSNKDEIPRYAVQEDGDYLIMRRGIFTNMPNHKKITSANFNFTINGKEYDLFIGGETAKLDGRFVKVEENLASKLFDLGLTSSHEPDHLTAACSDWDLEMKHATENAYKELVIFAHNL